MDFRKLLGIAAAVSLALAFPALAQVPTVSTINNDDLFQDVVHGQPTSQAKYVSALTMSGYTGSQAAKVNILVGGDASTNLFVHGTSGASVTTTLTYGGPNNFAYWSGTGTAMTVSRDTTAADLPATSYQAAFKMARTSGQTGVIPVCMAQEVETVNSVPFQGQVAELDFHAVAGANFSAAASALTAYIITGTGTDEGLSKMAFQFNGGGGGSSTWTTQATTVADIATISTTVDRYAAIGTIPAGTTEIGVMFCYTPVGTAGTNDYVAISGIQLTRNASLSGVGAQTVALSCTTGGIQCTSFDRRPQGAETVLQERYAYAINEGTQTAGSIIVGGGTALGTTTTCSAAIRFPVTMRAAPTYANALTASTFKITSASQAATILATPFSATLGANSVDAASINFTTTGMTAKDGCELVSAAGSGQMLFSAEL